MSDCTFQALLLATLECGWFGLWMTEAVLNVGGTSIADLWSVT